MKFDVDVTSDDLVALWRSFVRLRQNRVPNPKEGLLSFALIIIIVGAVLVAILNLFIPFDFPTAIITVVFGGSILWAVVRRQLLRGGLELPDGMYLGHHSYEFSDSGVSRASSHMQMSVQWRGVRSVYETSDHIFLMLDRSFGFIIPKWCVNPSDVMDFVTSKVKTNQLEADG